VAAFAITQETLNPPTLTLVKLNIWLHDIILLSFKLFQDKPSLSTFEEIA